MSILDKHINDIQKLCESHNVKRLYAFGSVLTDNFRKESDIDLIVDFNPIDISDYADNYFDLKFSLQDVLNRPVDLLEEKAIKNPYFKQAVQPKRQLVYGY
ncbi:nucleotidyltransferase family protein [Compostibacter hankyongensis]|uniref:Nucleotidyltransferase domain-containing protein n=1 Tax=Compostibacter hankyongensis TaxID=1007089 RepID=A0ABP8FEA5_9BACT